MRNRDPRDGKDRRMILHDLPAVDLAVSSQRRLEDWRRVDVAHDAFAAHHAVLNADLKWRLGHARAGERGFVDKRRMREVHNIVNQ